MLRSTMRLLGLRPWAGSTLPSSLPFIFQQPLTSFFEALSPSPLLLLTRTFFPDNHKGRISFGLPLPIVSSRIEYELTWTRKTDKGQQHQKSTKGGKRKGRWRNKAEERITPTVMFDAPLPLVF